jgi:small subunit ribosomal protein S16
MLKLRLKKFGRKKQAVYRIVVMDSRTRRDGAPIEELGFYSPIEKVFRIDKKRTILRLQQGVQPTKTVQNLLKRAEIVS